MLADFDARLATQPGLSGEKNGLIDFCHSTLLSGSFASPIPSGSMPSHGRICIAGFGLFWKAANLRQS